MYGQNCFSDAIISIMPSLGSVGKLTCKKASSSTITCLLLPGSSNVLVVFVEVAIANCDGTCTTVLLLLMANIPQ